MRKLTFLFACLLVGVSVVFAQTSFSGKVISAEDGEAIVGATVMVKGTTTGTITNVNGNFTISLPGSNRTLVVSYIGMKTIEVQVTPGIVIQLESDTEELEEVLVVAYGTVRREAKTGSISTVSAEQIANIPVSSIDKMLSGKLAGVTISSQSGQPGSSSTIRIRGTSSINAGNEPLYVVDGIAVMSGDQSTFTNTNNALAMINPSDIESVTVLKDAAAASVYGSRAANGVILITTKSGSEGKSKFAVRVKRGVSSLANDNNFGIMSPSELLGYQRQAIINSGRNPDDPTGSYYRPNELLTRTQTNWMDHMTRLGNLQEYEITAQGGTAKTKTYNSFSYHNNEGVFYGVGFEKMQARTNVEHELSKKLKIGTKINLGYMYGEDVPMQSLYYANPIFAGMTILPWSVAYTEDGKHNTDIAENAGTNPRATAEYDDQWEKQYRLNGNMFLEYKPIKGLTLRTTNGAEMTFNEGRRYWSPETNEGVAQLQTSQAQYRLLTTSNTAVYDGNQDKHAYRLLAGQEATHRTFMYNYQSSKDLDPKIPYHVSGNTSNDIEYDVNTSTLLSFFGVLDYNYDARYYLQASARYDASSKFGKNNQWGLFYSIGGSWNAHNEDFLNDFNEINLLKVRASYGLNGNNNIVDYRQYGVYATTSYNGVTGMRPSTPPNDNLSWEKNGTWNAGVDFRFLKHFSGSLDVYSRTTTDMLLNKPLSSTTGFTSALQNVGSMRNDGIEFQLDADLITRKDLNWTLGFNIAHNKSEILELSGDKMMDYVDDSRIKHIVGERLFTYYVRDYYGVNPVNGEALWLTEAGDLTNDFNKAAYVKSGSPEPKLTGGLSTSVRYKNFTLSTQLEYKFGNNVFIIENRYLQSDGNQMSMNQAKSVLNYWKEVGDTGVNPKPIAGNSSNSYSFASNRFIERGDFLRIKDLTLAYEIPTNLLKITGISAMKVYASGYNVFTFHDVNFWDPERGETGMGYGIYPMTKTFVIGLDLSF
ncbi:MAG: TonB-dependent receptor [Paludibacter sp.]|nr:TonB-dependent receptor [Paludibacter sp.]